MDNTTQMNIRLSHALLYDLEFIAQNLHISRNDWLKFKLAEVVKQEKQKIQKEIETDYIKGMISEEFFEKKMGIKPPEHLRKLRKPISKGAKNYFNESVAKFGKPPRKKDIFDHMSEAFP